MRVMLEIALGYGIFLAAAWLLCALAYPFVVIDEWLRDRAFRQSLENLRADRAREAAATAQAGRLAAP